VGETSTSVIALEIAYSPTPVSQPFGIMYSI